MPLCPLNEPQKWSLSGSSRKLSRQNWPRGSQQHIALKKNNLVMKWNQLVTDKYLIDRKLGEGAFGEVFLVQHRNLKIFRAMKVINKVEKAHCNSHEQLQILRELDHPNILKVFEYFQTKEKWYIITEYFQGKELFDVIVEDQCITETIAAQIVTEILKAFAYIHSRNITHRDIKAENILLRKEGQNYVVKIIDWGLGTLIRHEALIRQCGTPEYCAPQIFKGSYGLQCDMWSLGVLTYIMLSGFMPFKGNNINQTIEIVKKGKITFRNQLWETISPQAKQFIRGLLHKDPQLRLTAAQCLKHDWLLRCSKNCPVNHQPTLPNTLKRIRQFRGMTKFQIVVINYILNFLNSPKQNSRLKEQFEAIDENRDGQLSYDELLKAYTKIYGPEAEQIVLNIFVSLDLDCSGKISYSEFITFAAQMNYDFSVEELSQAFALFDTDGDGTIDRQEIRRIIEYQRGSQSDQFEKVLDNIDLNHDGKIDFKQFMDHMNQAAKNLRSQEIVNVKSQQNSEPIFKLSVQESDKKNKEQQPQKSSIKINGSSNQRQQLNVRAQSVQKSEQVTD